MKVDIYYDLLDADGDTQTVAAAISTNSGAAYNVNATDFTGDIGYPAFTGMHKHIVWDAANDLPLFSSTTVRVRITAYDSGAPTGMVYIPAGSFTPGNCMSASEGWASELPLHSVYVSAFYIDKYEVTSQKWFAVRNWAVANGYTFENTGSGKNATHPAQMMNWYDAVKWCNARSQMEGLTPCYYTSTVFAAETMYKAGPVDVSNDWVNWSANGDRLPTEAEWEKAARGGTPGHRFPWSDSDEIQHTRANYYSDTSFSYDTSLTRGYHPTFSSGSSPYTSPAGYFAANACGVYDMAGNVWEWCWDWHNSTYYSTSPGSNPRGPTSGSYRVLRGGSWNSYAFSARCSVRVNHLPNNQNDDVGFRCVRGL